jgi:hypothetical protein
MKKVTYILACFLVCLHFYSASQDTIPKNPSFLFISKSQTFKQDSTFYKTPRYKQGVICDFEDQLNRKKVPLNFQLGNSKY